eukprot:SAG31_NODE_31145_length_371_cov_1.316176_1_plen_101_part_01
MDEWSDKTPGKLADILSARYDGTVIDPSASSQGRPATDFHAMQLEDAEDRRSLVDLAAKFHYRNPWSDSGGARGHTRNPLPAELTSLTSKDAERDPLVNSA